MALDLKAVPLRVLFVASTQDFFNQYGPKIKKNKPLDTQYANTEEDALEYINSATKVILIVSDYVGKCLAQSLYCGVQTFNHIFGIINYSSNLEADSKFFKQLQ